MIRSSKCKIERQTVGGRVRRRRNDRDVLISSCRFDALDRCGRRNKTRMKPSILSKSPDRIAAMFDAIAGRYDFLNHLLSAGLDRRWRARVVRALQLTGRERVLDLCTGTADLALAAVVAQPGAAHVVGVDFAGAMLEAARE